jgi:hypothetical protein
MAHGYTDRRTFLAALAAIAVAADPERIDAQVKGTRLILLGTGGGPRPRSGSMATAQVIIAGDRLFVVDLW